ncbi:MAG: kinase, partial [bacterium]|nr:kinase [bacterium]
DVLKENVGCQDQVSTAFGGLSKIEFLPNQDISVSPIIISPERSQEFQDHLLLYFTGFSRIASEIAKDQVAQTGARQNELKRMRQMVDEGISILCSHDNLFSFGKLLNEGWQLKRSLTSKISSPRIDEIYETALSAGAIGGKLLGAGGGGFMLIFAKPEDHPAINERLKGLLRVPIQFENQGSQIIFYQPNATPESYAT